MRRSWQDSIYLQREELAQLLSEPLARLAARCAPVWGDREGLGEVLLEGFPQIPYCTQLFVVGTNGVQISDNVDRSGLLGQVTLWVIDDPLRYRILDREAMIDPNICLVYPILTYPSDAVIPRTDIAQILKTMQALRLADETIYLRTASINIFNGIISLTFSCDGTHYMHYVEFLLKDTVFWFGTAG